MKLWWLAFLVGCEGMVQDSDSDTDSGTGTEQATDTDSDTCAPMTATADPPALNPLQRGVVRVDGGTGDVSFALVDGQTGGILSDLTGEYLSGEDSGIDTVRVTDSCGIWAEATFEVLPRLVVIPASATVLRQQTLELEVSGGSSDIGCSVAFDRSGGSLEGCAWTTGALTGTDVIAVTDHVTAGVVFVDLRVREEVVLDIPDVVLVPLNTPMDIPVEGGSNVYDVSVLSGDGAVTDGLRVWADAPGEVILGVADHYVSGVQAEVRVIVAEPLSPTPSVDGITDSLQRVVTADLNNDGFYDAVVGQPNANALTHRAGIVTVYMGTPTGIASTPIQTFEGVWRVGQLGRDLVIGDVTGDQVPDLVVGEEGHFFSRGRVAIHQGNGDGTFGVEPWSELVGEFGGDRLGSGVDLCDIDRDGVLDIVVAARRHDDRTDTPTVPDVGAVYGWVSEPDGMAEAFAWKLSGRAFNEGSYDRARTEMGRNVRTGDLDADGRCDVAVATETADLVYVYLSNDVSTGLPELPSRVYSAVAGEEDFGWSLAIANLDGDRTDDLIVGAWRNDNGTLNRAGAVYVYKMADDDNRPSTSPVFHDEASITLYGSEANEEFGTMVGAIDLGNDGLPELYASGIRTDDLVNNAGGVQWWSGSIIAGAPYGAILDETTHFGAVYGEISEGGFGVGAAPLRHVPDAWVVTEGRSSERGPRVGDVIAAIPQLPLQSLEFPVYTGGALAGYVDTMMMADLGGPQPSLVVAAPLDGVLPNGPDAGQLAVVGENGPEAPWFSPGDEEGPVMPDYRAGIHTGWKIRPVGDVDGDGAVDLGVVVRFQRNRPDLYRATVHNPDECRNNLGGVGGVAVYRGGEAVGNPDYLVYGPVQNGRIEQVAGADLNGDGFGDLIFNSPSATPDRVTVAFGVAPEELSVVLCDMRSFSAGTNGDILGDDIAALGDIDGDGCEDVAIGAPSADPGGSNRGAVHVLFGWGENCETGEPRQTGLAGPINNGRVGVRVEAADVDGDGIVELLLGAPDSGAGAVYMRTTSDLADYAQALDDVFQDAELVLEPAVLLGDQNGSDFGRGLAVIDTEDGVWLAVAQPFYDFIADDPESQDSTFDVGRVSLFRWQDNTWIRRGLVGLDLSHAEGATQGAELGHGLVGGDGVLLIGAPRSGGVTRDHGAVYRFDLDD